MTKIGNAQSRVTFFRHSAVLILPAVLLRKLSIVSKGKTACKTNVKIISKIAECAHEMES